MLTERDIARLHALFRLEREHRLSDFLASVVSEVRRRGVGQDRELSKDGEYRIVPPIGPVERAFQLLYQPPTDPHQDEIVYACFPNGWMEIADELLRDAMSEDG